MTRTLDINATIFDPKVTSLMCVDCREPYHAGHVCMDPLRDQIRHGKAKV